MRNRILRTGLACAIGALLGASSLMADDGDHDRGRDRAKFLVSGDLIGYQEVPALSTVARGRFVAWVDTRANTITFRLKYDALEGDVTQAHVHFGQHGVNGGISFFLCSNLGNGPPGTQACPAAPGEVSGVISPELVIGPGPSATGPGQGIEPGAFAEIAAAIREGVAYANVHSTKWPGGEIRAQLH